KEVTTSEKYQLINETIRKHNLKRHVSHLCEIAGVKRNSYYAWLKAEPKRLERETKDEEDYQLIKQIHDSKKGKLGGRVIKMRLENIYD
ncbi:IS3 family transposase, partial [Fictibacillus phosphorivorans]|nr:IS3 family transposase [Fictibacillus phosphorivorans]MCM3778052.1 IS3 family transposase [Fictibacillus phosphorivorans]